MELDLYCSPPRVWIVYIFNTFYSFQYALFISPYLFISLMHSWITCFLALHGRDQRRWWKVKMPCDRGYLVRLTKSTFGIMET